MNPMDMLENIVPLVLPTQLDSKDLDENEKTEDDDEEINEDVETNQYDDIWT